MFNARAAKALAPGAHITIDEAPGLRLVATETRRTWTYRFKSPVDGNMRQVKLGEWPAMSPAEAISAWDRLRKQRVGRGRFGWCRLRRQTPPFVPSSWSGGSEAAA